MEIGFARLDSGDFPRMRELMRVYRDLPMDLADASLVRVAERDGIRRIFTLDRRGFENFPPIQAWQAPSRSRFYSRTTRLEYAQGATITYMSMTESADVPA